MAGHIPSSAQKIASSVQRIRKDIDPYVYNQRLQAARQQKTQQIEIPQGYHQQATEEFQNKCLLSYTKTRDNIIVPKFPLPRVLLHEHTNTTEAEDRHFFTKIVNKSVRDAISSHNEAFLDIFHNAMKEAIHGFLVGQVGLAYYNIPHPSTQGTNQVGTSH